MDNKMETTKKNTKMEQKLTYNQLLKQWSEQTTQKLPNKGPKIVYNTYKTPHNLNDKETCEIS